MNSKKASKIAIIHTLTMSAIAEVLFEKTTEMTITKSYFRETIAIEAAKITAKTIPLCLDLVKSGMHVSLALMLAKSKKLDDILSGATVVRISEHTDCESCDKAEHCDIKELMVKVNKIRTDIDLSPSDALKKAQELIKNPVRNLSDDSPKASQN